MRGNTPVYLYDIYYPIKLKCKEEVFKTDLISSLFKNTNYITLIGDAGSGKSTFVKHLFLNSIYTKFSIPILIELRYLNEYDGDFQSYIINKILENKLSENSTILYRLLEKGKFVFFLDGYDELTVEIKPKIIDNINSFVNEFDKNKYILTTRPYSNIEQLPLFHNFYIKDLSLTDGEIEGFIFKQLDNEIELAKKMVDSIEANKDNYINSFLANPLLLSLYILTFQSNASIPDKKYIFYRRVINALFSEHDSKTKLGFVREKLSGLNQEEFEELLKTYCFLSFFEGKINWDYDYINQKFKTIKVKKNIKFNNNKVLKDLRSAIALWVEDNGSYSFVHRSLQEYFAALFIKHLQIPAKQMTYEKIIDRFSEKKTFNELENFLSLLNEMDTLSFKKFYLLPILKELRLIIDEKDDEVLVTSLLGLVVKSVSKTNRKSNFNATFYKAAIDGIETHDEFVYKTIYLNLNFSRAVISELRGFQKSLARTVTSIDKHKEDTLIQFESVKSDNYTIPSLTYLNQDYYNLIKSKILPIAKEFNTFINENISNYESEIKNSLTIDKGFVDLI